MLDVGANIGYFTVKFASWVTGPGKVIAIEPEERNFERLVERISRLPNQGSVMPIKAAAIESTGKVKLKVSRFNPADHRLAEDGTEVKAVTIDEIVEKENCHPVCLIKIDVQGAEERVVRGAEKTLDVYHPVLYVEVDHNGLREQGGSLEGLYSILDRYNYKAYSIERELISGPYSSSTISDIVKKKGYRDFLFK